MCGIVGYVGRQEAAPILLDGLERLEYRGYDSAGIAVCGDGVLRLCKKKGRVAALRELTHDGGDLPGTLGIGHTRWATHGEPNDVNAHPHMSQSGKFAVVHNGIIENFITLKEELQQKGYVFQSETDTEVVAQLLDYYYSDCGDFFEAMNRLLHAVDGAYALGIICADYPDRLVAARKDAPLLLGFGDGENFIASDVTALVKYTRDIAYMDDGELAILSRSGIRVYDRQLRPVEKKHHHVDWEVDAAEKGGYAHFMLKEIMEQPAAIRKATAARIQGGRVVLQDLTMTPEQIRAMGRIYIVACGSSYHVGMVGKYNLERMLRRSVEVSSGMPTPSWGRGTWSSSSASPARRWTPWPPCGRPKSGGHAFCPSSTWWAPPLPGSPTTCCIPGPGRRSPWPPPRPTAPRWRC